MWTAAIIAGGKASRLGGRHKCLLPLGPARIIDRQLAVLSSMTDRLLIVANQTDRFREFGLPVVPDLVPGAGTLGGIYTAITAAQTQQTLVIAGDMPFLTMTVLARVVDAGRDVEVAIPRNAAGYQPLCASYAKACADRLRRRIDACQLKVIDILPDFIVREIGPEEIATLDPDGLTLFNVNTPDDYARAIDLINQNPNLDARGTAPL